MAVQPFTRRESRSKHQEQDEHGGGGATGSYDAVARNPRYASVLNLAWRRDQACNAAGSEFVRYIDSRLLESFNCDPSQAHSVTFI